MQVSFVIPTLNQAAFIRRCLDRCLEQNLPDAEIIVRDGLSTDGTQDVLREYGERIRWVSEKDDGQSQAINRGIESACGEIIAWINSDDYYTGPGVLKRVLEVFDSDGALEIVYGDAGLVDRQERFIRKFASQPVDDLKQILIHPASFVAQPSVFFKRDLFLRVGKLNPQYHLAMDFDLWLRMFLVAKKSRYLPQTFTCVTMHADAKSVQHTSRQLQETYDIKRKYFAQFNLNAWDRLLIEWGGLRNRLYCRLISAGLYQPFKPQTVR